MSAPLAQPRPGPRWGDYPERPATEQVERAGIVWRDSHDGLGAWRRWAMPYLSPAQRMKVMGPWLKAVRHHLDHQQSPGETSDALRRHGWHARVLPQALACVYQALAHTTGKRLSDQQLLATAWLLDQRLVELPTGEGKTLALASAAAVAALAGVPTHVITANDYLAERDMRSLAPFWQYLGLSVAHVGPSTPPSERQTHYACDVVYTTAKEIAFDHLRDHVHGPLISQPVLRGLCLALVDEADNVLLDEATVPLIITAPQQADKTALAQRRALWWQAWQLAQALHWGVDAQGVDQGANARLLPSGIDKLQVHSNLGGLWRRPRLRQALIEQALTAQHLLHRDQHYLISDGKVQLLDALSGRMAHGRAWSQGLQALIELKEGCAVSPPSETIARTTFQRFFQSYWHLAGISGTLTESRHEFAQVYGLDIRVIPPQRPSRRHDLPLRVFSNEEARWLAAVGTVRERHRRGQAVLIGTDSVADSEILSQRLSAAGLPHQVLNARSAEHEAAIIASAGVSGAITVATRMAGRGTDIELDQAAVDAGGLHVIHCQRNASGRLDRQLLGRSARQGQAGSTETWICHSIFGSRTHSLPSMLHKGSSAAVGWALWRLTQWMDTRRQALARHQLLERDKQWEQHHRKARRQGSGSP